MPDRRLFLLQALGLPAVLQANPAPPLPTLRFALGETWAPPFVVRDGKQVTGGLLPSLMRAIAAELGLQAELQLLPPARVDLALEDGSVDLQCLLSPSWAPQLRDPARWSPPLLRLRDLLVAGPAGPADEAALAGQSWLVGTVRGYHYPSLEARFASGALRRDDALGQGAVLDKLARAHTPLGVVNEFVLRDWQRRHPGRGLRVLDVVEETAGHCLFGAKPQLPPARMRQAIQRLVDSGRAAALIRPYLAEPPVRGSGSSKEQAR